MLLLRHEAVQEAMQSAQVIDALERMLSRPGAGMLALPPRLTVEDERGGFLRLMPVIASDTGYAGFKAMNLHPAYGVRYMIAMIALANGELAALLDADWITAYRTAATAAIAVRHLKPRAAQTLAVIGSGTQARALLDAVSRVLAPRRVLVYSPTAANRERFAAEMAARLGVSIEAAASAEEATRDAGVVLSAYRAKSTPLIHAAMVRPGALVCGISSVRPRHREVDVSLWEASRVVVDDLAHVRESGDGRAAAERGLCGEENVCELWRVLRDASLGRRSEDERVLFKSVGTAEQDIALAALVIERATARGLGEQLGEFPALRPIQSESDRARLCGNPR
ncbi:MAG: ornithine cyclodeaminase family protein [Burkholderiales bacterium]|nr:ornithine cyclodeaminase family protein [Burkholderiales bacterium]